MHAAAAYFAYGGMKFRLKSSPHSFLKPVVPQPLRWEIPKMQPYPILSGMSMLRIAVQRLAVSAASGCHSGLGTWDASRSFSEVVFPKGRR